MRPTVPHRTASPSNSSPPLPLTMRYQSPIKKPKRSIALGVPKATVWTEADINQAMAEAKAGSLKDTYGVAATTLFRDTVSNLPYSRQIRHGHWDSKTVDGSHFAAPGSRKRDHVGVFIPTLCRKHHAQIPTLQPQEFREEYLAGTLCNSLTALFRALCWSIRDWVGGTATPSIRGGRMSVTKPGGFLYLSVCPLERTPFVSNWHRVYGRLRWPLVAANWRPWTSNSTGNGQELTRDISQAAQNGGFGYKFTKDSLRD
jgi:hypothetical protein